MPLLYPRSRCNLDQERVSMDQLRMILTKFNDAGLESAEVAMMEFAQKIILNANEITQSDVDMINR